MDVTQRLHLVAREKTAENFLRLMFYGEYYERQHPNPGADGPDYVHVFKVAPRRSMKLLHGSSIYWVLDGFIQIRSDILKIEDGEIAISPRPVPTLWKPKQVRGEWEYLTADVAPPDVYNIDEGGADFPPEMLDMYKKLNILDWLN
ncbi:MAG: DUF1489 family protein [Hyphomicrobiales bacterium]